MSRVGIRIKEFMFALPLSVLCHSEMVLPACAAHNFDAELVNMNSREFLRVSLFQLCLTVRALSISAKLGHDP